jgi:hypothetical protein
MPKDYAYRDPRWVHRDRGIFRRARFPYSLFLLVIAMLVLGFLK